MQGTWKPKPLRSPQDLSDQPVCTDEFSATVSAGRSTQFCAGRGEARFEVNGHSNQDRNLLPTSLAGVEVFDVKRRIPLLYPRNQPFALPHVDVELFRKILRCIQCIEVIVEVHLDPLSSNIIVVIGITDENVDTHRPPRAWQ